MPAPGFQALILCGPGVSLNTFTSNPKDFPKALVPIANRPMVWYPLEWCYRLGITSTSIAVAESPSDFPSRAETGYPCPGGPDTDHWHWRVFRLPEVQDAITGDFIVLPCDLVCELDGASLLEAWMIREAGLGGATGGITEEGRFLPMSVGGEKSGRRGGLGVWYQTKGEGSVKGEETDFVATTPLPEPIVPPPPGSLRPDLANLVYSVPTDTLNDITEAHKSFPHGRIKMLSSHRDAHIYFFPFWVLEMMKRNPKFDSVSEDVVGWWAKAGWQDGLGDKIGLRDIFEKWAGDSDNEDPLSSSGMLDEKVNVAGMSSTCVSATPAQDEPRRSSTTQLASRAGSATLVADAPKPRLTVPPILAYVHPSVENAPLIRRVDTAPLLLNISLALAKQPALDTPDRAFTSPTPTQSIPQRCRVDASDSLLAENVTVEEKVNIKESVIGAGCKISEGARLLRCLLMEGVEVAEAKDEKFMRFEGLSDEGEGFGEEDEGLDDGATGDLMA
ncbi:Translation initiation factor eIF-2B subunit gamma [Coniosporium tulheliwenetii]|uniref:Translation initiation factor eIF-2B subunit gamma n=1 Tax=Coniosporium tulheliwenetii TaxID=3383036 RepID=A0ACC2YT43_9PEZI|nr:Translation initiation factor eIF-2B subunit gamma [Cladosporium sp. JES 115]